jgi:hypothetical protein
LLNNRRNGNAASSITASAQLHPKNHENIPNHGDLIRLDIRKKTFGSARARLGSQNLSMYAPVFRM